MNKNNIILIAIVGVIAIGAAYYFMYFRQPVTSGQPGSFQQQPPSSKLLERIKYYSEQIDSGNAAEVLPDIDSKIASLQNSESLDMLFYMYEIKGDALMKMAKCEDAVKTYGLALGQLQKVLEDRKTTEIGLISAKDKGKFEEKLNVKLAGAKQCKTQ